MIMTILKQSTRFYLDEKEFAVADCYADMYCKMILQYINQRDRAVAALRDLAYEFYILGHYRSAKKYYQAIKENYGVAALRDQDMCHLAESEMKVGHLEEALEVYQQVLHHYPTSSHVRTAYKSMSKIWERCGNRMKANHLNQLANKAKRNSTPRKKVKTTA